MNLSLDNPRLAEIERIASRSPFSDVAMWRTWAQHVKDNIRQFAGEGFYLTQGQPVEEYERVAKMVGQWLCPMTDVKYGATIVSTSMGPVCRAGLESVIEAEFIFRHLPNIQTAIDIGAGYGRLADILSLRLRVQCIDAVPVSTFISEQYLEDSTAEVLTLDQIPEEGFTHDLAINVHSWSECSLPQIERWLGTLKKVPYLFTVAHDATYTSWCGPSFRPLLEQYYELMAPEEFNAVQRECPHAMWRRK